MTKEENKSADQQRKLVSEFETIDHGVNHAQYFQGCGVAFTEFDECATGAGENAKEAFDDALEMLAQNGWDVTSIEESLDGIDFAGQDAEEASVHNHLVKQGQDDEERGDDCELYYYVSIRVK